MPMGNPLSPTVADIVLDDLLDNTIQELNNKGILINFITKYVDDTLLIINKKDINEIQNTFNKYHQKIQFTFEIETNNSISYLDAKLIRNGSSIKFDWYHKSMASGRIMNYHTTQPKSQIINTAKSFIMRVLRISDQDFHKSNINEITKILINNSFPKKVITQLIQDTIRKLKDGSPNNREETHKYCSLKYIPGLTDNRNMKMIINKTQNICYAYKANKTISQIFSNVKTPIDKQQQHNIVYEIECNGNDEQSCDLVYIGTTKRTLQTRMGEHKTDIEKGTQKTALAQHISKTGHKANFENVKILDKESKDDKRYTIESLRIQQKIERTMNLKEDTNNISVSYRIAI